MDRTGSIPARLRALPPARLDALLGALVLVDGVLEVLLISRLHGIGELALGFAVAACVAVAVALRRRVPVLAVAIGWSAMLAADQVGPDLVDNVAGPYFANMFVTFTAGYVLEGRRLWTAAAIASAISLLSTVADDYANEAGDFVFAVGLGVGGPLLLGQLLRNRTRLNQALHDKAVRVEGERARETEAAALEERTRIAGELHDVVAHALSAMTVQAGAARRLAEREPAGAASAFAAVEHTGREALTELRRLLGVLRKEDEELALAPQPSLAHVDGLAQRATAAGLPVALTVAGAPRSLPAGVDLTAYRVVQEALGRARNGGSAGRADVIVTYGAAEVAIEVHDDGGTDGRALLGMRERVTVYGGELSTAALDGGGWRVTARLPVEPAA